MKKEIIKIFKSLADTTRLEVVRVMASLNEVTCQDLQKHFKLSQPTLSHHFNKLIETNILLYRKEGKMNYYKLNKKLLADHGININKFINK